ncbi:MAG: hypothetical protein ACM33U_08220 [Solirubrobacterales bacterium]|nr:hypothetical protein [Solirubrobacterales bacterium]
MPPPSPIAAAAAVLATASILLGAAGCGQKQNDLAPAACLVTSRGYLRALERAPAPVRLAGTTPISDCLVPEQDGGQLANIGHEMVTSATKLNVEARRDPAGPAALQLGYLIGAVGKGADTIHTDLVRRLNAGARFSAAGRSLSAEFERAFGRGYAAGHTSG